MLTLKDEGNELFKSGRYSEALGCYQQALHAAVDMDKAIIYKNMAAVHLKMERFQDAIDDTTAG